MVVLIAALVASSLISWQSRVEEPAAQAAGAWVRCVDEAIPRTSSIADFQARVARVIDSCTIHESELRRITAEAVVAAGGHTDSPETLKVIEDSIAGLREKIRARVEKGLSAGPLVIWNGLQSGIPAEAAAQDLARRGIETKLGKPDSDGWAVLRLKERVPVAGHKAAVGLNFFKNRLFWSEVTYTFVGSDRDESYTTMIGALTELYGQPVTNNYLPDVAHASTAGVVLRQNATFRKNGVRVDITVNSSPIARTASGDITSRKNVILTYWRDVDATAYANAISRNEQNEENAALRKAKEGL